MGAGDGGGWFEEEREQQPDIESAIFAEYKPFLSKQQYLISAVIFDTETDGSIYCINFPSNRERPKIESRGIGSGGLYKGKRMSFEVYKIESDSDLQNLVKVYESGMLVGGKKDLIKFKHVNKLDRRIISESQRLIKSLNRKEEDVFESLDKNN